MAVNHHAAQPPGGPARQLLEQLLRSGARERLLGKLARALPGVERAMLEDALQDVCEQVALQGNPNHCPTGSEEALASWLYTSSLRLVCRRLRRGAGHFEEPAGPDPAALLRAGQAPSVEAEVLRREKERELDQAAKLATAELPERQRQVLVLHSNGLRAPQIADYLRLSRRTVKRLKEKSLARSRGALGRAAGRGCEGGEELVLRFAFGLANEIECRAAQLHLAGCETCAALYARLDAWHEKIAALLPIPTAPQADPALVERVAHKTADALAQAKQQLADTAGLAKQHASASYARAVEYSPLATARPGAAATTAIAGCLALVGGTATYCVENNVNPVTGLAEVVRSEPAKSKPQPPRKKARVAQQTPDPPQLPPVAQPPPPAPAPAPTPEPAPAPAPAPVAPPPAPALEPPPPPPPEPTPAGVEFGEPATPTATQTPAPQPARPAPAPASGGSDLYGP